MKMNCCFFVVFCSVILHVDSWGNEKILLSDVKTLTLMNGRMTTARRSAPVAQLQCTGGSAGCGKFIPSVVQCTNKGTDGHDVQWECKADMNNELRFGKIEVSCEGYDYPEDPYVLKGSCGLEYMIEYTGSGGHGGGYSGYTSPSYTKSSSGFSDLVLLAIAGIVIYAIYRTCVSNTPQPTTADRPYPSAPPPPGFRPEYTNDRGTGSAGCNSNTYDSHNSRGGGGAGFWSGAGLGSLAGYLFGSRRPGGHSYTGYGNPGYGSRSSWWGGNGSSGSYSGSSGFSSGSGGSRTASGFGGTKRR